MGNHAAGRAMGKAAEMALKMRANQPALELLDMICEPYRDCDAEFEGEDPNGPLGTLIAEAFGEPGRDYMTGWPDDEDAVDAWYDGPYATFRARYAFC